MPQAPEHARDYATIADDYARAVVSGEIVAGKLMRLACARHLDDLRKTFFGDQPHYFDRWHADDICDFVEKLPHVKGEWLKPTIQLEPPQVFILACTFGWRRTGGYRRFSTVYIEMARKGAKALDLNTPIPTPTGWTLMGDLVVGDEVFDERGFPCRVTAASQIYEDHDCYEVEFSDGTKIVADAGHRWRTNSRRKGNGRNGRKRDAEDDVRTTAEIAATLRAGNGSRVEWNHSIPVAGPLRLPAAELPIPPYTLGAWLGDGHSASARLTLGHGNEEIVAQIVSEGVSADETPSGSTARLYLLGSRGRGSVPRHSLQAHLRAENLLNNKHIPEVYLRASETQRMALLQGLMDTDGTIDLRGHCAFVTTRRELGHGVMDLLWSLGFKPTCTEERAKLNGRDCGPLWRIRFVARADRPVFRLSRKRERLKPAKIESTRTRTRQIVACTPVTPRPVRCIQVDSPSHLFLAGRAMVPTHNSTLTAGVALYCLCCENEVGPEVIIGATTGEQAGKVFEPAKQMVEKLPELQEAFSLETYARSVACRMNNGSIQPINAKGKTQDGWNPHVGILDELHAHKDRSLYDVIKSAFGSRKNPLFWIITTAGFDTNGVCYEQRSVAVKMLEGAIQLDHLFAAIFTLDAEAHDDTLEFPRCLLEFENSCGPALTTLIERSWVEVCAKHAITLGTMPETEALAEIILTSPLTAWGFVENVTQQNLMRDTPTSKSENASKNRNGSTLTEIASTLSEPNGESRKVPRGVYVIDSRPNTASRWSATKSSLSSLTGSAASAATLRKLCAWITVTARDAFGDSYAFNATLRSAFSETLARVWRELSRTCDQKTYSIDGTVLTVKRPPDDPFDEKNWIKANPMIGITPSWAKMRSDSKDAQVSPREEGNFKTKNLNIWMNAASAWLNITQWNLCADPALHWDDFKGLDCWIGGDLADKDDITALVLAAIDKRGRLIFKPRFWLPEAVLKQPDHAEGRGPAPYRTWSSGEDPPLTLTPGDWVDHGEVEKVVRDWIKRFGVKKVTFDQFAAAQLMATNINNDLGSADRPIAQILHKNAKNVSDPAKELEARVKAGPLRMRHDGNPVMTWMASNCVVSRRRDETLIPIKETQMSPNKIDGIDALINAIQPMVLVPEKEEKQEFQMFFV